MKATGTGMCHGYAVRFRYAEADFVIQRKLKIFSDRSFLKPGQRHAQILFPFWGVVQKSHIGPQLARFDRWAREGHQSFEFTSLEDCDLAIVPAEEGDWSTMKESALRFVALANAAHKRSALFFCSDSAEPLDVPDCYVFRTSLDEAKRQPREFAMPAWSEDFVKEYWNEELPIRQKTDYPMVGFCGQPGPLELARRLKVVPRAIVYALFDIFGPETLKKKIRQRRLEEGLYPGFDPSYIRAAAFRALRKSNQVKTNFLFRHGYFDLCDDALQMMARRDLLSNNLESDYILCVRGQGNFSYRLYETLCSGRIPVFINTHCVLPFQEQLDWKSFCVWIEAEDVHNIGQMVAEFHAALTPEEFIALQKRCRQIWQEWLSPEGFFLKLSKYFIDQRDEK